jgi:hypothetical protein
MKAYWESGCKLHSFFDLGTRWRWVVSFTTRPLYPQGKSPWYPFNGRLGGPQSRSGHYTNDNHANAVFKRFWVSSQTYNFCFKHFSTLWTFDGMQRQFLTLCCVTAAQYTYLLTYLLTYSMVQNIIWKADCYSARQKISRFLKEPEGSSPCSQKPATGPYSEPAESSSPHRSLSPQGPS